MMDKLTSTDMNERLPAGKVDEHRTALDESLLEDVSGGASDQPSRASNFLWDATGDVAWDMSDERR